MSIEPITLSLLEASAKGFTARHRVDFDRVESSQDASLLRELLGEVAQLGWLETLHDPEAHTNTDDDALLLARIVYVLGGASPAFAGRLLAHHYARACVNGYRATAGGGFQSLDGVWYGLEVCVGDRTLGPTSHIDLATTERPLKGIARSVIGGDLAPYWVTSARLNQGDRALVLVDAAATAEATAVPTLGLRGLGVTDAELRELGAEHFVVLASGDDLETRIARADHFIAPGYLALIRSLVEQTQMLVTNHTDTRRQNGVLLREIPAVQEQLRNMRQAIALAALAEHAWLDDGSSTREAIEMVRQVAQTATDAGLQALGGAGYVVGHGVERLWRDCLELGALFLRDSW
ncbi:MAG TPA: acyl-CoA dehydrogenase family protein [Polyangiaceae bacterium]|nr:acyl-CoA dehydrogenase family protein [Polyangiaceae bacterium]